LSTGVGASETANLEEIIMKTRVASQIGLVENVKVRCSLPLWRTLGWEGYDLHPLDYSPEPDPFQITSLVGTPFSDELGRPIKLQLVCGDPE
jgi:hypothetical protein